ncbi:DMT family transporter [Photobacterium piscicola]|uniref:DMT family transporter n=3 Tax=Photobacterium piscicola TaxID=1378299 RepID=A0ABU6LJN1_9GAMM|nr:DMT family transporter [Photobacterium piscicola]MEC6899547.1 DMT family transporter [Photobacterium piscicola]MEC6907823.1 DMT family transporter [Photobacterium piscicola]
MKITIFAILAPLLWGTTYAVLSAFFSGWSPFVLSVWRALPAGILLLIIKPTLPKLSELPVIFIISFLNVTLFFSLLFIAALHLPSALVGVGMITLPVVGLAVMGIIHQVKPSIIQLLSASILIICSSYLFLTSKESINIESIIYLIGAMFVLILGSVLVKHVVTKINWWKLLTWKLIFGGIMLIPLAYWQYYYSGHSFIYPIPQTLYQWGAILWLIISLGAISYGAYIYTIPKITTNELSFYGTLNPILAIILGATIMGEKFTMLQFFVIVIMVISNFLAQYYEYKKKLPTEQSIIRY